MNERRDAVADNLRSLATDLKNLVDSATTDPKERRKKERRWRALQGALGAIATLAARKAATRAWTVLTGEHPPVRRF